MLTTCENPAKAQFDSLLNLKREKKTALCAAADISG